MSDRAVKGSVEDVLSGSTQATIVHGDRLAVLATIPDDSISSVVWDAEYGLSEEPDVAEVLAAWMSGQEYHHGAGFMGRAWDDLPPGPEVFRALYRVLKPGAFVAVFGHPRTFDLLGISGRLAGFERHDTLAWLYAQGMGHGLDMAKGAGSEWTGWNTRMVPAYEPIALFRKPFSGNVASNVLQHGTGSLHIGACKIENGDTRDHIVCTGDLKRHGIYSDKGGSKNLGKTTAGREAKNVLLSHSDECTQIGNAKIRGSNHPGGGTRPGGFHNVGAPSGSGIPCAPGKAGPDGFETVATFSCVPGCPVAALNEQAGDRVSGANPTRRAEKFRSVLGTFSGQSEVTPRRGTESGPVSRYFQQFFASKAPPRERWGWCQTCRVVVQPSERDQHPDGDHSVVFHVAVKPLELCRWLARLLTPPGGIVLVPGCGSGSEVVGAVMEGFSAIGIENDPDHHGYVEIARARVSDAVKRASPPDSNPNIQLPLFGAE